MASNSDWSPFLSYWGYYYKGTLKHLKWGDDQGLQYSEGLLNSLCYETDVGSIPRGIKLDSGVTAPRYGNTDNWNRQIQGCYWCVADDTSWNGICCSKECFFYLHDWCIERVELFTKRRFCRFPGCEMGAATNDRYCDRKHKGKFDAAFPKGADFNSILRIVIRAGPDWYSSSGISQTLPQPKKDNKGTSPTVKDTRNNSTQNKDTKNKSTKNKDTKNQPDNNAVPYDMKFPAELCNAMVYKTDIGVIPRHGIEEEHLSSPYSSSPNWLREIPGCIRCGNRSTNIRGNSNFCTYRCYLLFYEWCRRLVETLTGVRLCRNTGCDRLAAEGFVCCNREHTKALEKKYSQVKSRDFERLIALGPNWYRKCDFPKDIIVGTKTHQIISPLVTQQPPTPASEHKSRVQSQGANIGETQGTSSKETNPPPSPNSFKANIKMEDDENNLISSVPVFTQGEGKIPLSEGYELQFNFTNENSDQQQPRELNSNANQPMNSTNPFCGKFDLIELSEPVADKINPFISVLSAESTQRDYNLNIQSPTRVGHMNEQVSSQFCETNTMQTSTESQSLLLQPLIDLTIQGTVPQNPIIGSSHHNINFKLADVKSQCQSTEQLVISPSYCETKFQIPSDYDSPFNLPQTDNLDTEPSPQMPTFTNKLITLAGAQVRNKIETSRQEVEATTSVLTDPMYTVPNTNTRIDLRLQRSQSLIEQNPDQSSGVLPDIHPFSLATKLTDMLYQYTDVGVIPRHRAPHSPAPREHAAQSNWGARIVGCYWCELNNTSFHELTCSRRCWLLFHEWCVRKIETGCGTRMCALPGCENSRADGCVCCSLGHIRDLSELRGSASLSMEEEVEIILGPKWYSDLSPINFSRTGAFYEFSNYFPSLLILEDSIWPTVYHYLCARKLVGTPYSNHISRMECVGELEMWMKRRTCGKWVRADWSRVWEGATYRAMFAKFQQNSVLRGLLLRTGRRPLVCRDSSLGDVLVGLRERFRTQRFFPTGQLEALINPAYKSINNPTIVSKTSLVHSPSQDGESLPTEKSDIKNSE